MLERIANGRTDLVSDWLHAGGDPSVRIKNAPLLTWCAYYGDVSAIRLLIERGIQLASLGDNLDLGGAAFHGHWRLCAFLLEQGADANFQDASTGETALHLAASVALRPGNEMVLAVLLRAGADPNRATQAGVETGAFMRDCRTRGETALHRAAAFCSERAIEGLIEAGAAKDVRDANGDTPLSWASWHQRPSGILRRLCFGQFSINAQAHWTGDHGAGWRGMDSHLLGNPVAETV